MRLSPGRELTTVAINLPIGREYVGGGNGYGQHSVDNFWMTWDQFDVQMRELAEAHIGAMP